METQNLLSSSLEDYLEAIYNLVSENKVARSKDIASNLNVTRASVTGALKHLSLKGLINYDPYQFITMTERGEKVAKLIVRRHEILKEFLVDILSIDHELADESACKMEHAISGEVIDKLLQFANFIKKNESRFLDGFKEFECNCMNDIDKTREYKG